MQNPGKSPQLTQSQQSKPDLSWHKTTTRQLTNKTYFKSWYIERERGEAQGCSFIRECLLPASTTVKKK